ncbi:MAG: hypothetical protein AAB288_00495, partial [Acidobacteriota bacterium]
YDAAHLNESAYLQTVYLSASPTQLLNTLENLLLSGIHERIDAASTFLKDICLMAPDQTREQFRQSLHNSNVIAAAHQNLLSGDHFVRLDTAYLLGKIGWVESLPIMRDAFNRFRMNDPICSHSILSEIQWLLHGTQWPLIDQMMACPSYLSRWAIIRFVEPTSNLYRNPEYYAQLKSRLEALAADENERVRREASYHLKYAVEVIEAKLDKQEKRKRARAIRKTTPELTFDHLPGRFHNWMGENKRRDYVVSELDAFVRTQP